jgi:serine/threonine-protein kinase
MPKALTKASRYQLVRELGRGSMGVVYEGFDPVIGRRVAIKTMLTEGLSEQEFQEYKTRFQREAQAAGILAHPNIVTVYDFGEEGGVLYLAMEYLEGISLEKLVEEQNVLPLETILSIFDQVCSALNHAHRHQIVHRDIKPANIMILDTGLVKVTDFGVAKMMSLGMTQAGQVLGTPNYMSPEQVRGRQVDGRCDIFSLGIVLYELTTGRKPFAGQNITTVIYKIINEDPIPPRELDATIHPGLSYVICKALAKNPEERYQTCRELADDLKNFKALGGQASPAATVALEAPPAPSRGVERASGPALESSVVSAVPAPPVPSLPVVLPQSSPAPAQVLPPPKLSPKPHTPALVWTLVILGAVVLLGLVGGGGYLFFRGRSRGANQQAVQTAQPVNTPTQNPVSNPPAAPATPSAQAPQAQIKAPPETSAAFKPKPAKEVSAAPAAVTSRGGGKPAVAPEIGQLLVTANVPGASISVDGNREAEWITPHTIPNLSAGTHDVVVSKEGYDNYQADVTIEGGKTNSLNARLSAPSGQVRIVTVPPGLDVTIDGKLMGPSPVQANLSAGDHKYAILRPGQEPYESTFNLGRGSIENIKITLGEK